MTTFKYKYIEVTETKQFCRGKRVACKDVKGWKRKEVKEEWDRLDAKFPFSDNFVSCVFEINTEQVCFEDDNNQSANKQ